MSTLTTINGSDNISAGDNVINANFTALNNEKIETSTLDTDTSLAANSDSKIATQKAVKAYVDAGGNVNASETTRGIVEEATDAEVTAGTATGATTAKLFITPTKLLTYLASVFGVGVPPKHRIMTTYFETAGRFTAILNSGTNTFSTSGFEMDTSGTTTRAAGITSTIGAGASAAIFAGSPVFTCTINVKTLGTTGSSFFGIGVVTKDGTGHTYTTDHIGFKVLMAASVASLYTTQGDGVTETASSALTTLTTNDQVDIMFKVNGTGSVDYYWQKNGGGWSAATNKTTNMPAVQTNIWQMSISNNSTATQQVMTVASMSYSR